VLGRPNDRPDIMFSRYDGQAWSELGIAVAGPEPGQATSSLPILLSSLSSDPLGNALLVWEGSSQRTVSGTIFTTKTVNVARFVNGWQPSVVAYQSPELSVLTVPLFYPVGTLSANGSAAILWSQSDQSVQAASAPAGRSWSAPTVLKPGNTEDRPPANGGLRWLVMDDQGTAHAFFMTSPANSSTFNIWRSQLSAGQWSARVRHDRETPPGGSSVLGVALNASGTVMTAWGQRDNVVNAQNELIYARELARR